MAEKSIAECETEIQELTEQLTLSRNMYDELFDQQKLAKEERAMIVETLKGWEISFRRLGLPRAAGVVHDLLLKLGETL